MSLKPISNNIIADIERLISTGATYKEIKEKCKVSDGTIAKIKQGKITSARIIQPQCDSREVELSLLYNNEKKKKNEIIDKHNLLIDKIEKLEYKLKEKEKELINMERDKDKYQSLYENLEIYHNNLKSDFKALVDSQHNISSVRHKESLKNASELGEINILGDSKEEPKKNKMNSFDAGIKTTHFFD